MAFDGVLTGIGRDFYACLRFFSHLPLPTLPFEAQARALPLSLRMAPAAGAALGLVCALVLWLTLAAGLPPLLAATLTVTASLALTGALHEDGLADVADGFGGGATRARKLEIMRDSRHGTFGVAAIVLSLVARSAALAALVERFDWEGAMAATIVAAGVSRAACLLPLALLPPARADGLGQSAAGPDRQGLLVVGAASLALLALLPLAGVGTALAGLLGALCAALAMVRLAHAQIGGQTGDVAGAAQQAAEIAFLAGLLIRPGAA